MLLFFATLDSKRPPNWVHMHIGIPARWRFGTIIFFCMAFVSSVTGLSADVWTSSQFARCRNRDENNAPQKHGKPPDQWGSLGEEDMWDTHGHSLHCGRVSPNVDSTLGVDQPPMWTSTTRIYTSIHTPDVVPLRGECHPHWG